ncbi:protein ABHD4-like [Papaver somniferum]|uniref:protein ABHD4-like n=1 Tax=Papaver somniferum TaxID=3469 RepID=UPI000E6F6727|nr:protein ABHD4-like [Papaver somniferum]
MATSSSCFSLVSMFESYLKNTFTSTGLTPKSIDIDSDTTLHYWSPKQPSKLPPLVLLHGFGGHSVWQWSKQVQCLSSHFTLYVPDLIFFGKSITKSPERSEVFQAVSMGKLLELLGVARYSVLGTSYGGFVAYHMARLWPDRVEKVVIVNSAINLRRKDSEELMKKAKIEKIESLFMPDSPAELRTCLRLINHKRFPIYIPEFLLNDVLNKLCNENRKEKLELLRGTTVGKEDIVSILPLQQEILIVWGEDDPIFPLEKGYDLKELIGDKVTMKVMLKASHTPQSENPKLFNGIVMKFLFGSTKAI